MRPAFLIAHTDLGDPGGGTAVFAWAAQALATRYDLTVVTAREAPMAAIDARFGTELRKLDIRVLAPPRRLQRALACSSIRAERVKALALAALARQARRKLGQPAALSTSNELDLGRPAWQYVHYPYACSSASSAGFSVGRRVLACAYLALTSPPWQRALHNARTNVALCNSEYTREAYRRAYGVQPALLYPPVPALPCATPWAQRAARVVCVGRFAHEKRWFEAIEVVERARKCGAPLTLELLGAAENPALTRSLALAARTRPWLEVRPDLHRPALLQRLQRARFGLHMTIDEPFGIAVAELIRSGCVTLAHDSAGPREILPDRALLFRNLDDAAERLATLARDETRALALHALCAERGQQFSEQAFMRGLLHAIEAPEQRDLHARSPRFGSK